MLNLPTPVDVKQEHMTNITAANHVTNNVTNNVNNHVTSQPMAFHNNGSMHNNGTVKKVVFENKDILIMSVWKDFLC